MFLKNPVAALLNFRGPKRTQQQQSKTTLIQITNRHAKKEFNH